MTFNHGFLGSSPSALTTKTPYNKLISTSDDLIDARGVDHFNGWLGKLRSSFVRRTHCRSCEGSGDGREPGNEITLAQSLCRL